VTWLPWKQRRSQGRHFYRWSKCSSISDKHKLKRSGRYWLTFQRCLLPPSLGQHPRIQSSSFLQCCSMHFAYSDCPCYQAKYRVSKISYRAVNLSQKNSKQPTAVGKMCQDGRCFNLVIYYPRCSRTAGPWEWEVLIPDKLIYSPCFCALHYLSFGSAIRWGEGWAGGVEICGNMGRDWCHPKTTTRIIHHPTAWGPPS
jgi:hypothetical protein